MKERVMGDKREWEERNTPYNIKHLKFVVDLLCMYLQYVGKYVYSGAPLNGHPSIADTHDITDNSESPDRFSIDFNTSETPE